MCEDDRISASKELCKLCKLLLYVRDLKWVVYRYHSIDLISRE